MKILKIPFNELLHFWLEELIKTQSEGDTIMYASRIFGLVAYADSIGLISQYEMQDILGAKADIIRKKEFGQELLDKNY